MKKIVVLIGCILLTCCSNNKSEANSKVSPKPVASVAVLNPKPSATYKAQTQDPETNESGYKPHFMKASEVLKSMKTRKNLYIFDVRGKISYDEGHIKTSLSKPLPMDAKNLVNIPKDAHIITYCGCPHHLSSIAAEQLSKMGYKDVHVLDEGYWYWKDHKYPLEISASVLAKLTEMSVAGVLMKNGKPLGNTDIYMKHIKSGQLEAEKTDPNGKYKMNFHLYNYNKNDEFGFFVSNDLNKSVQKFKTDKKDSSGIIVNIK